MVQLTRIYTKGGDKGKTSLGTGKRVSKSSVRIASIGDVDEVNASLGLVRLHTNGELDRLLSHIQNDLFDMGADLCVPEDTSNEEVLRIQEGQITYLEKNIDTYNECLPHLTSFVLPGGTALAASLHFARTVARRAERTISHLKEEESINEKVLQYINRLSDLLFVLARTANHQAEGDILWVPGANR